LRPIEPGTTVQRLTRAVAVTLAGGDGTVAVEVVEGADAPGRAQARLSVPGSSPASLVTLGMAAQRLLTAAWSEDLLAEIGPLEVTPDGTRLLIPAEGARRA
jgi:hypothetical protein